MNKRRVMQGIAVGGAAFAAVGFVAPGAVLRLYRVPDSAHMRSLLREWATRNAALSLLTLRAGDNVDDVAVVIAGMVSVDAAVAVTDAIRGVVDRK
jgi:hypothetical protein